MYRQKLAQKIILNCESKLYWASVDNNSTEIQFLPKKFIDGGRYGVSLIEVPAIWGVDLSAFTALSSLPNIARIELYGNGLVGQLPKQWGNEMPHLKIFDVCPNALDGALPPEWGGMTSLRALLLCHNNFSGLLPKEWEGMRSLYNVDFEKIRRDVAYHQRRPSSSTSPKMPHRSIASNFFG